MLRRIRASAEEKRRKGTEAVTSTTQKDVEEIRKKSRHNLFEKKEPGTVQKGYRQSECCSDSSFVDRFHEGHRDGEEEERKKEERHKKETRIKNQ